MNKAEDYASDSDLSDEDFCPENEAASELSEVSSDDEIDDEANTKEINKSGKSKNNARKPNSKAKKQAANETQRSTRQRNEKEDAAASKKFNKDKLESDDEDKEHVDALWADFLGDVKKTDETTETKKKAITPTTSPTKTCDKTRNTNAKSSPKTNSDINNGTHARNETKEATKEIIITEIMDFAGEEVKVQKVVSAASVKENKSTTPAKNALGTLSARSGNEIGGKRAAAPSGSGLGSILNQIGKKKKISVLEKTKLDWNSFKQDQGIEEALQTFNKGKDGYLERQDFLERTDLRQFEIERNLRQTRRNQ